LFDWNVHGATRSFWLTVSAAASIASISTAATAQDDSPTSPAKLPRPGYEYDGIQIGSLQVNAEVDASIDYSSNIFLTSANEADDFRLHITPTLSVIKEVGSGAITAEGHMGLRRHFSIERENSTTFGGSLNYVLSGTKAQNFSTTVAFNRNIERRGDPETRSGPTDRPRKINAFLAEAAFTRASGRVRVTAAAGTEKYNQLDPAEDDRDMQIYRGSLTVGYTMASSLDVFGQVYANRRDFRLAQDFSGVNRDQNTYGAIFGVQREIGNRLYGKMGVGIFKTDPAEDTLVSAHTGLRLDGEVTWAPRDRTALNFRISKGDVATVRSGASTRVDTVARFKIDQEIRHNLLGQVSVSYVDLRYLGESRGSLKNASINVRLEYLFDRRTSFFAAAEYDRRTASDPIDKYKEAVFTLGIARRF
jgi:hypothetical protein